MRIKDTYGEVIFEDDLDTMKETVKAAVGSNADLEHADLGGVDLTGVDLKGVSLEGADLRGVDLEGTNLAGVSLDYSCMPLWCGDLEAHYDEKQIIQQLYHVLSHVQNSKHASDELKATLLTEKNVSKANQFHRTSECGNLKTFEAKLKTTIKTRSIGNLEFSITKEGGYLKVWDNESKEMRQCMSEGFFGSSISSTSETIAKDARKWWAKNKNCFA